MLDTVLLAVGPGDADRSDQLAEAVLEVAKPAGATVVLAHVHERRVQPGARSPRLRPERRRDRPDAVASRHSTIHDLQDVLDEHDVDYEIRGAVGEHGPSIVDLAASTGADRVVVGGRRRSPTGRPSSARRPRKYCSRRHVPSPSSGARNSRTDRRRSALERQRVGGERGSSHSYGLL